MSAPLSFAQRKALTYAARPIGHRLRTTGNLPRRDVRERLNELGLTRLDDELGWTVTEAGREVLEQLLKAER